MPGLPGLDIVASDGQTTVFSWLKNYLDEASAALMMHPASATATADELLSKSESHLETIGSYGTECRQYSMKALVMFSRRLAQEVDSRIAAVRWQCLLSSWLQAHRVYQSTRSR